MERDTFCNLEKASLWQYQVEYFLLLEFHDVKHFPKANCKEILLRVLLYLYLLMKTKAGFQ